MGAAFGVTGCSQGPAAVPTAQQPPRQQQPTREYRLTATIQDLMDGIIDPSADVLWDSVAYIATTKGVEDRQPRTDEQWKAVRTGAITLIEAANLLSMPGRQVAKDGPNSPPAGLGELSHPEIQQRIGASHEGFASLARNLQDAGLKALAAIDAKDPQALLDAGGTIDEACEACHVTFWYPNQKRPES
jgi:cytochrome c556